MGEKELRNPLPNPALFKAYRNYIKQSAKEFDILDYGKFEKDVTDIINFERSLSKVRKIAFLHFLTEVVSFVGKVGYQNHRFSRIPFNDSG